MKDYNCKKNQNKKSCNDKWPTIVLPEGSTMIPFSHSEPECTYAGNSTEFYQSANGLNGSFSLFSMPHNETSTMPRLPRLCAYLNKYKGKYICIDLWTNGNSRIERCGFLQEVGEDFISILGTNPRKLLILDLKPIKFISVYCR